MQPASEHLGVPYRSCLQRQDQEHRLERIVGILALAGRAAAHAQHQWAISGYQFSKGSVVSLPHESSEQVAIGANSFVQLPENYRGSGPGHRTALFI